jgi:hypothetical protein
MPLGSALGLAMASPYDADGAAKGLTAMAVIWLIIVQWLASGLGGYMTGRLRTKWVGAHTHEVFFRDTVHGFLSWALATVIGALLITAAISHNAGLASAGTVPEMMRSSRMHGPQDRMNYMADSLFRTDQPSATTTPATDQERAEAGRILGMSGRNGLSDTDRAYLVRQISTRTGLPESEASTRLDNLIAQQKATLDEARKAGATTALFVFLSLVIGAFIATAAGALGGRHRDLHYETGSLKA